MIFLLFLLLLSLLPAVVTMIVPKRGVIWWGPLSTIGIYMLPEYLFAGDSGPAGLIMVPFLGLLMVSNVVACLIRLAMLLGVWLGAQREYR